LGLGRLVFPDDDDEHRLGYQLLLFRRIAEGKLDSTNIALRFSYTTGDRNDLVRQLGNTIFEPMAKDLRRHLENEVNKSEAATDIPASDRLVTINHNNPAYKDVMGAMHDLESALTRLLNSSEDAARTTRLIKEVQAGRTLLEATLGRLDALKTTVLNTLKELYKSAKEQEIKALAKHGLEVLHKLFWDCWDSFT
jgi:hypothetical protein